MDFLSHLIAMGCHSAGKISCNLSASTGIHDGEKEMINRLEKWLASKRYTQLSDFKGKMSQDKGRDPSIYERAQFMRYFGGKKNINI